MIPPQLATRLRRILPISIFKFELRMEVGTRCTAPFENNDVGLLTSLYCSGHLVQGRR